MSCCAWVSMLFGLTFGAAACSPTAAELITAGRWSAGARDSCLTDLERCKPAIGCSGAVQVMASEGAGRPHVRAAEVACVPPSGSVRAAWTLGQLAEAAGEVAGALAERLRERERVRVEVLRQATSDLAAEKLRAERLRLLTPRVSEPPCTPVAAGVCSASGRSSP